MVIVFKIKEKLAQICLQKYMDHWMFSQQLHKQQKFADLMSDSMPHKNFEPTLSSLIDDQARQIDLSVILSFWNKWSCLLGRAIPLRLHG